MEERNYNRDALMAQKQALESKLNQQQMHIDDIILSASSNNHQELLLVYEHGGTGKTFLWKAVITALCLDGKIVLAVASSVIASLLLPSGQTAHSRFKLPLQLNDEAMCNVRKKTNLGTLLHQADLIVWDEAQINDKLCFEALDIMLRDLSDNENVPFGDPQQYCINDEDNGLSQLISYIYDEDTLQRPTATKLQQRVIVCPKNNEADSINSTILSMVATQLTTYRSEDAVTSHVNDGGESELLYPTEYLNTLNIPNYSTHELQLKIGVPVILLRNISVKGGLCNCYQI
ncbi:uncharacterized protein [Rutidosis leptorrhynchoides]|uniref:uncharacterized protein n=1 Tax=Rutidosis leptorrhynchoides TaxID=125765 RepID=UPI003A9A46B6